jgi:hypothetical protein
MEPYIGIYYTEWLNSSPRMSHWTDYVDAKIDAMQIQIAGSKTAQMLLRARVAELEAENARLREALERIAMPGVEELTVAERIAVFPTAWQCIKCARAALSVQP